MGYPPPFPRKCEQTENITFPHPSDADGKYSGTMIITVTDVIETNCKINQFEGMERDCEVISDLRDNGSFFVRILDEETPEQRQKFQEELK